MGQESSLSLELTTNEPYYSNIDRMSYYRYITGLYKSYWPELNRTLRSSSVPRTLPETDPGHYVRGTSMPPVLTDYIPGTHVTDTYYSARRGRSATPFRDAYQSLAAATVSCYRSMSVQPASYSTSRTLGSESSHYSDFDCKVLSYAASLNRNETTRNFVSKSRNYTTDYSHLSRNATRDYDTDSFSGMITTLGTNMAEMDSIHAPVRCWVPGSTSTDLRTHSTQGTPVPGVH